MDWVVREMGGIHNSPFLKKAEEAAGAVDEFVDGLLRFGI